ncbi:antitoxin Xre/MbcA/ParS toxin-binding domain-containing protein [Pseudomonas matsuisoli]|uniref:Antitoxin Xre/MbcA/ParS-like toxin-binding domain-containing protein n=1 Tax=Pseudomonas matsuisoli TaxID=1515666 RepID=A0A917PZM7_9PSED|nr:antitoxin Xre/MbcA/ParS toxin-binding domain-containing protein [Pseudomonas matsuisoli]GGK02383.1 hypothetical protein GCM10009304_30240 [Pseudomonas matsuisoli]
MDSVYEGQLAVDYGSLLDTYGTSRNDTFACQCASGWFGLVYAALGILNSYKKHRDQKIIVVQIKEKFGKLRIYCGGTNAFSEIALEIIEMVSGHVCECCGAEGELANDRGWLNVRCGEHHLTTSIQSVEASKLMMLAHGRKLASVILDIVCQFGVQSAAWARLPATALGGLTPAEVLSTESGCDKVMVLLSRLNDSVLD